MNKSKLVKQFLEGKTMPQQTAAKHLHSKHPDIFKSVEHARDLVRYVTGKKGTVALKKAKTFIKGYVADKHPFVIKSLAKDIDFFKLPIKVGKGLILSDIHLPYHDTKALSVALEYGKKQKINFIYLNGDIVDCYQISRFSKKENMAPYIYELKVLLDFIDMLKKEFPNVKIFYKIGNHEKRNEDYFSVNAPALFAWSQLTWKQIVKLPSFEIDPLTHRPLFPEDDDGDLIVNPIDRLVTVIPENKICKIGEGNEALYILHGHERKMSSPVNAARALFNKSLVNSVVGHFHQVSEHNERQLSGKLITCWSLGCLSHLQPEYDPYNSKWMHGFGILEVNGSHWNFDNLKILNGKVRG